MKTRANLQCAGFTLIEVLIYLALFAIVIGGGMVAAYQIIESINASGNHIILQEEANFMIRKINWALAGASHIEADNTLLAITNDALAESEGCLIFNGQNGLHLSRSDRETCSIVQSDFKLHSERVEISELAFEAITSANDEAGVIVSFRLTTKNGGRQSSQYFSYTKYLRQ